MNRSEIKLHNIDCLPFMRELPNNAFDLAIVDPPYGININPNIGLGKGQKKRHEKIKWDNEIPPIQYFEELFRVSKNQIIWGGQLFSTSAYKTFYFLGQNESRRAKF